MHRLLVGAACVLSLLGAVSAANAATLVAEFSFDDGTADDSVGSLSGELFGDASISSGILLLDGLGDYVELGGYALPQDNRDYSILIVAQQTIRPNSFVELISQGASGPGGMYIGHDPNGVFRFGDAINLSGQTGLAYPSDGQFHTFLLTSSTASGTSFYIDGALSYSSTIYADVAVGGTFTRFGRQFGSIGEFFTGGIDYIGVFDGIAPADIVPDVSVVPIPLSAALLPVGLVLLGGVKARSKKRFLQS